MSNHSPTIDFNHPFEDKSNQTITEVRRLLPANGEPVASLEDYQRMGGLQGLAHAKVLSRMELVRTVKDSGLRGRGGAGFPTGVKWETVLSQEGTSRYVVCNAAEGEPGTYKDRFLIRKNPYQLIEGILIACRAINAKYAVIGTKKKFTAELTRLREATAAFEQADIMPRGYIEIVEGPDEYLFGEEKALIEVISGRGAMPRIMPPYMVGIRETPTSLNPTVVNNAETYSHLPFILREGAEAFKKEGNSGTSGTMIFTLSGDVKRPGMYELPMGTTLYNLIYELGGGPAGEYPVKAVFSGVANPVITPDQFNTPLDFESMKKAGSGLGSGGFIVYDESMCMVRVALMFARFLSESSCGQCLPCSSGTEKITHWLNLLEQGRGTPSDLKSIAYETGRMTNQTRCYLPVQASKLVPSIIQKFHEEFMEHLEYPCPCHRDFVLPKIADYDETQVQFSYD